MNEQSFISFMAAPARALARRPVREPRLLGRGDKRDRILAAATSVFARHGFFGAQVADVARAADVAAGTVYLYFHSKDIEAPWEDERERTHERRVEDRSRTTVDDAKYRPNQNTNSALSTRKSER